ncbi:sulfatase-like hydrolase/transferase [Vulgatibacter sp.]|uniref:sulfatase-like hydrolase/transferase n=1 Tax=Vulgatibacter sp. TaxID=1971226 RepID=UPI0035675C54
MSARSYLRPALFWALLHGLLVVLFFAGPLARAVEPLPGATAAALRFGFVLQGLFVGLVAFLATLPLLVLGRRYAVAAPLLLGLVGLFFLFDSLVYASLGFHVNGLVLQVAMQPGALEETGLPAGEVALFGVAVVAVLALDTWLGSRFLRRFAGGRRTWPWALAVLLLWVGDRLAVAGLTFDGGQAVMAAGTTMPLQPPIRMNKLLGKLTGRKAVADLRLDTLPQAGTPPGKLDPASVHFRRKPDVVVLLIESLRADFLTPEVMPSLVRRAEAGTVFTRHHASASSTHFALFSLFYGLDAQRRDAVIGAGRSPLLFPALKANGYQTSLLAASSVDWMDLKETVFRDVLDGLQTDFKGVGHTRDVQMMERAEAIVAGARQEAPLFLFLFFDGTHFNYTYPERSAVFAPAWDGKGSMAAARVDPALLVARAKNAAREVDTKIEAFLQHWQATRGTRPTLIVTGDHGEEFREHGRVGHSSDVTREQIHVPMVVIDEILEPGRIDRVTGHVDVVPTLFSLLGDEHDPSLFADGLPMHTAPADRYILATVGWEPRFALVGAELKVRFLGQDGGFGSVQVTDLFDRPLPDGEARFRAEAPRLIRTLRGQMGSQTLSAAP